MLDSLPEEVKVVTIVNNHTADAGDPRRLAEALTKRGKVVVGPANPAVASTTIGGIAVDFLAAYFTLPRWCLSYNGVRADALEKMLVTSTAERKIVNLHWGYEHTDVPAPFERQLAHRLIDAGTDLIIGHHPHVPQGWEVYNGKFIYYSLGNFNFCQFGGERNESCWWGYMVDYDLASGEVKRVPYRINENYQPFAVSGEEEQELTSRLHQLSKAISSIDDRTWFSTDYAGWYARETKVWKRRCLEQRSLPLWLKWFAWLCLPMQWKYRLYARCHHQTRVPEEN